jgi:hypothetical protein
MPSNAASDGPEMSTHLTKKRANSEAATTVSRPNKSTRMTPNSIAGHSKDEQKSNVRRSGPGFFDLPRELRDRIYGLLQRETGALWYRTDAVCQVEYFDFLIPRLCRINRQFKAEYEEEICRRMTIHVSINTLRASAGDHRKKRAVMEEEERLLRQEFARMARALHARNVAIVSTPWAPHSFPRRCQALGCFSAATYVEEDLLTPLQTDVMELMGTYASIAVESLPELRTVKLLVETKTVCLEQPVKAGHFDLCESSLLHCSILAVSLRKSAQLCGASYSSMQAELTIHPTH